ncbi:MAG TPA: N-6 DNA methylase [Polyangiaceae bacterium]|nr:N-6 DNA methylase [Polyangiaceae bacterium]
MEIARVVASLDALLEEPGAPYEELRLEALRAFALRSARGLGLVCGDEVPEGRLFAGSGAVRLEHAFPEASELDQARAASELGQLLEALLAHDVQRGRLVATRSRKRSGSFYTPSAITAVLVEQSLERLRTLPGWPRVKVCDPSAGAGAFLLAAGRGLEPALGRRAIVEQCLYGVDISPLAIAVAETALWLYVGERDFTPAMAGRNLLVADTLALARGALPAFDLVLGNPPWVAYAGRAAQPLTSAQRRRYQVTFAAFKGYPTLHGLFVERAAELAPRGTIALLLPSPLADLDGYRHVRRALTRTHLVREPLLEFGQDAFDGVTQPCFALLADAAEQSGPGEERPFRLAERQRVAGAAAEVAPPAAVLRLLGSEPLPRELFGEMGFQSNRVVSERLFRRGPAGDGHDYPLLEGKDVAEFRVGQPRLFLKADQAVLRRSGCRLRAAGDYQRVRFVVRQTAKMPIAALHTGLPFRNTLLAGFDHGEFTPELMVGLLNSALFRALHLAARRDARQATFPQVKVAHLRALPRPPDNSELRARVAELARSATGGGVDAALRAALDESVFDLFELRPEERHEVVAFVSMRS